MRTRRIASALMIGAAVAAPAATAQTVEIYGRLFPYTLSEKGAGATPAGTPVATLTGTPTGISSSDDRKGLQAGNSRLGFRGQEDLGGGLKAFFQLEGVVSVDSGAANLFNRDSYVGLEGGFGTVYLGRAITVFRGAGNPIGIFGLHPGTFMSNTDLLRGTGFGTSSASSFHLRRGNSIYYTAPKFYDVEARFQYSTDEAKAGTRDPRLVSMSLAYDKGPFYVAVAHEIHYDFFGGSANAPAAMRNNAAADPTNSKDRATSFTVEYRLSKQHKFAFDAARKEYVENATVAGRFQNYKNMAYGLAMESQWGSFWRTAVTYVTAGAGTCARVAATCVTDGLEADKFVVGVSYALSKRSMVFGSFGKLNNGKSARYSSYELGPTATPGENITQYALGLSHSF